MRQTYARGSSDARAREKARFYNISEGSLEELRYYLLLAVDLRYLREAGALERELDEIARMLRSLIRAVLARPDDSP